MIKTGDVVVVEVRTLKIYPNDLAVNPSKFRGVVSSDTMYGRVGGNVGDTIY